MMNVYNKIFLILLISIFFIGTIASGDKNAKTITVNYERSNGIMNNPHMGFYVAGWNHTKKTDLPPYTNLLYHRFMWKDLESQKGNLTLKKLKNFITYWRNNDCRVAFRVITSNVRGTQTPDYVFKEGVPGVIHRARKGIQQDPVYWNSLYIDLFSQFIEKLGRELNGGEEIEFVDVGGIGVFGEMHLGLHIPGMWTKEELKKYEFSNERHLDAYKNLISVYKNAFPNTRLFLNISRYEQIADYAAKNNVGLRFDGLILKHYPTFTMVSQAFQKYSLNSDKGFRGVPSMYEFARKETEPVIIAQCLEKGFKDPISYLHLNLGKSSLLKSGVAEIISRYATRIGYRFFLQSITVPKIVEAGRTVTINQTWRNEGVANAYSDYSLQYDIVSDNKRIFVQVINPDPPTTLWLPGTSVTFSHMVKLPSDLPEGDYNVYLEMFDRKTGKMILIANKEREKTGNIQLVAFQVINGKIIFET